MNNVIFTTLNGKTICIKFGEKTYEYSVESLSIDVSDLVKEIAESKITEELNINTENLDNYLNDNESDPMFKELYTFLKNIPEKYNEAVKEMKESKK